MPSTSSASTASAARGAHGGLTPSVARVGRGRSSAAGLAVFVSVVLLGLGGRRCFARLATRGDVNHTREEVIPSFGVARDRAIWQSAVDEPEARAGSSGLEIDLDGARSGRDHLVPFPAPGAHTAPVPDDLGVLPSRDVRRARAPDAAR